MRKRLRLTGGIECTVTGKIPINTGTSSSALINCWAKTLTEYDPNFPLMSKNDFANISYLAEVVEFKEPGGMMDQYTTAIGGIEFMNFSNNLADLTSIDYKFKTFVLGDFGEPKDTKYRK